MNGIFDETKKVHIVDIGEEDNDKIDQNDTVVEVESSGEEVTSSGSKQSHESRKHKHKKKSEAELLKTSLYNDLGLYFNDVIKSKFKAHEPPKDLHVDHIRREKRNIMWVNPIIPSVPNFTPLKEEDRNPFIRKVFTMVCFNLTVIIVFQLLVLNIDLFAELFMGMTGLILGLIGLAMVVIAQYIIMYNYGRTCPCTGIAWVFVVVGSCFIIAVMVVKVHFTALIIAFLTTATVVLLCIALASTSFDFTKYSIYLIAIGMVLVMFSLGVTMVRFVFNMKLTILHLIISFLFAIYHTVSLIIQIQMVIGGHSLEIESSQYILGGVLITISIVNLFIEILKLVVGFSSD